MNPSNTTTNTPSNPTTSSPLKLVLHFFYEADTPSFFRLSYIFSARKDKQNKLSSEFIALHCTIGELYAP
jgi:hypothetical protein